MPASVCTLLPRARTDRLRFAASQRPNIPEATLVSGNTYRTSFSVTGADTYEVGVSFSGQALQAVNGTTMVVEPGTTISARTLLCMRAPR